MIEKIIIDASIGVPTWLVSSGIVKGLGLHFGWFTDITRDNDKVNAISLLWPIMLFGLTAGTLATYLFKGPSALFAAGEKSALVLSKQATGKEAELEVVGGKVAVKHGELVDERSYAARQARSVYGRY